MAARSISRQRKPPAPPSFYAEALSRAERSELQAALEIEDIDEEIALLRLQLRKTLEERPDDLALMFRGIELLAKAVATRYRLSKKAESDLAESLAGVVHGFGNLMEAGGES